MIQRGGVNICVGSLPDCVPYDDNFFDYIFALDVLEHVENDRAALKTLKKKLKPNGKLIITVPAFMSMWSHNDEVAHHFRRYEQAELLEKVKESGLKILNYSFFNTFLYPFAKAVRAFKNKFKIKSSDLESSGNFLTNAILTKVFAAEKYFLRKHRFNVGVSLIMDCEK